MSKTVKIQAVCLACSFICLACSFFAMIAACFSALRRFFSARSARKSLSCCAYSALYSLLFVDAVLPRASSAARVRHCTCRSNHSAPLNRHLLAPFFTCDPPYSFITFPHPAYQQAIYNIIAIGIVPRFSKTLFLSILSDLFDKRRLLRAGYRMRGSLKSATQSDRRLQRPQFLVRSENACQCAYFTTFMTMRCMSAATSARVAVLRGRRVLSA